MTVEHKQSLVSDRSYYSQTIEIRDDWGSMPISSGLEFATNPGFRSLRAAFSDVNGKRPDHLASGSSSCMTVCPLQLFIEIAADNNAQSADTQPDTVKESPLSQR